MIILRNLVLFIILCIITYTDFKRQEIDHEPIIIGLFFITLFSLCGLNDVTTKESIIGFLIGGISFTILAFWGMGGGDIKLMAMIGFFLGWRLTILAAYSSFVVGSVVGIGVVLFKRKSLKDYIPFGPFIAIGTTFAMFYGNYIINSLDILWFLRGA